MINTDIQYDVIILGGGLAGLSLARQLLLAKDNLNIAIIESRKHPLSEAAHKVGESLVEIGAHYFKERLELSDHLQNEQLKKAGLRFFFPKNGNLDIAERPEFGATFFPKTPSFQLDRGRFENYLREVVCEQGAYFSDEAKVRDVELLDNHHHVNFSKDDGLNTIKGRWVVDATGRYSFLKRKLKLTEKNDHDINAAWFRVKGEIDIDTWSEKPQWLDAVPRRFRHLSTNHLMGEGYWVWLIPLASGNTSVGIVAENKRFDFTDINTLEKAKTWLKQHEPQLAALLESGLHDVMDFNVLKHYSHGCKQLFSSDRWALTGEAGLFADPFYSPGSDFIAISNDFVSDLILNDLETNDIRLKSAFYNKQYLELFHSFMMIYQDQYALMGSAGIMTQKIIWDYAVYWGTISLLYFNQKYTDLEFMLSIAREMSLIVEKNKQMQAFFKDCFEQGLNTDVEHFTDTMSVDFLYQWNCDLLTPLSDDEIKSRLSDNLKMLDDIALHMQKKIKTATEENA